MSQWIVWVKPDRNTAIILAWKQLFQLTELICIFLGKQTFYLESLKPSNTAEFQKSIRNTTLNFRCYLDLRFQIVQTKD